jgi:serine/threonine-protein kinase
MPEWIGTTVGKVRIEREIAKGGMAEVFLGTHLTLDRPVAVKVMHNYIESDPDLQSRFEREAKVVAALRHPNIIQIFDFDTADGHPYIVMEYLKGPTLATYLRELHKRNDRLPPARIARLLTALASGLDYAHEEGVIHRDIKPGNIILHNKGRELSTEDPLTPNTEPVITDFGLVRIAQSATQTASGVVSGTPAYMSPEQAQGLRVDHRSDIYSLGVVLYEMVAGRVPFEADTSWTVILKHINESPPPIMGIQPPVQGVIERVLAKNPDMRHQTCRELAVDYMNAIGMISESQTMRVSSQSLPLAVSTNTATRDKPLPVSVSEKRDQAKGLNWKRVAGFAIGALVLCIFGWAALQRLSQAATPTEPPTDPATEPPAQIAPTETLPPIEEPTPETILFPPPADGIPVGVLRFQDGAAALDQITIFAALATPPEGTQYQAILIGDGGELRRSLGVPVQDESGQFTLTFVDPQSRNLMDRFHRLEITLEPNPDDNPNPTGQTIYSSEIPLESLVHIRHVLFSIGDTPNQVSLIHGMTTHVFLIVQSADAILAAFDAGDEAGVRSNAEILINLIVGNQEATLYGDWNGDGTVSDIGDGYGMLLNGEQQGYILGTISHAGYAASAADSTPDIRLHGDHVVVSMQNVEAWMPELRDTVIRIAQAPFDENMRADISAAVALANQILNGLDIDASETVDPISGEGGVLTAYEHAYYMADMPILPGANQIPAP